MSGIAEHLVKIRTRIDRAAERAGRDPAVVRLVAVSKTFPARIAREAVEAGAVILGESYAQEAKAKMAALTELEIEWHFIGRLQTNKAKEVVSGFSLVHSVDRLKLAQALNRRVAGRPEGGPLPVLIQVNLAGEESKGGAAESQALDLIKAVAGMENLEPRGLMVMPPFFAQPERARPFFSRLAGLAREARQGTGLALPELSMGMSGDFEVAVEEGATLVRVGSAIFGARNYKG